MPIDNSQVKSKTMVAYILQSHPETSVYLPATEVLKKKSFVSMLEKYNQVYLKPDGGRKSRGVFQVTRLTDEKYLIRDSIGSINNEFESISDLWTSVKSLTTHRKYVIQKSIKSVTTDGRSFDLRCHVLNVNNEWVLGGICARLGSPGNIVTTSHIGGTPTLLQNLFSDLLNYSEQDCKVVMERLNDCILNAVKVVSPVYPNNFEFAVDIGLDTDKKVWIYEVNNEPLIRGNFKLLPDKSLYYSIRTLRTIARKQRNEKKTAQS